MNETIRRASAEDLKQLHAICYPHLGWSHYLAFAQQILRWQEIGRARWLLLELDGRLVGNGQLMAYPSCIELSNLSIVEDARGRGLGTMLVNALEAEAIALGQHAIEIGVDETNGRAHDLYIRLGYEFDRSTITPSGQSVYILRKTLPE